MIGRAGVIRLAPAVDDHRIGNGRQGAGEVDRVRPGAGDVERNRVEAGRIVGREDRLAQRDAVAIFRREQAPDRGGVAVDRVAGGRDSDNRAGVGKADLERDVFAGYGRTGYVEPRAARIAPGRIEPCVNLPVCRVARNANGSRTDCR